MTYLITIPGTHGIVHEDRWWRPGSLWWQAAEKEGFRHPCPEDPFFWDTDLEGTLGENYGWIAAGAALRWCCERFRDKSHNYRIIAFSHGGQVAAYGLSEFLFRLDWGLITIGTPVRHELEDIYYAASLGLSTWRHIHSDERDIWQAAGSISDQWWGDRFTRKMPYANNIEAPGLSHAMLVDPNIWDAKGWWELLR